jgi:hypothetical protein
MMTENGECGKASLPRVRPIPHRVRVKHMPIIAKRICNALIKEAEPDLVVAQIVAGGLGVGAGINTVGPVLRLFKKSYGGLWVGGTAVLTEQALSFHPNVLNLALHKGDYSLEIPLKAITDVQDKGGIITKIIEVRTSTGTLAIRCFWAKAFSDAIRAAVRAHTWC